MSTKKQKTSIAEELQSSAARLDSAVSGKIQSESDHILLKDKLRESEIQGFLLDRLSGCYSALVKAFRNVGREFKPDRLYPSMVKDETLIFSLNETLEVLGYAPLQNGNDAVNEFYDAHNFTRSFSTSYSHCLLAEDVAALIRDCKFPKWIRKKLSAWFEAFVAELKGRRL